MQARQRHRGIHPDDLRVLKAFQQVLAAHRRQDILNDLTAYGASAEVVGAVADLSDGLLRGHALSRAVQWRGQHPNDTHRAAWLAVALLDPMRSLRLNSGGRYQAMKSCIEQHGRQATHEQRLAVVANTAISFGGNGLARWGLASVLAQLCQHVGVTPPGSESDAEAWLLSGS